MRYCDKCIRERNRILPKFAMGWCKPLAYGWCIIALLNAIYTYLLVVERRWNFLLIDQWEKNESMLGHFSGGKREETTWGICDGFYREN